MTDIRTRHDYLETILVAAHRLTRIASARTGDTSSPAVWRTLSILRAEGALRIGALATASRVSQPTMTKLLANLVEQQLVYRIADVDDSRASLIALSDTGERAIDEHRRELGDALEPLFRDLSAADRAALERAASILESTAATKEDIA